MFDSSSPSNEARPSSLRRFSLSAVCVLVSRVLAFVAVFGFNAVLARTLDPAEFGMFALLFSVAMLTCLIASLGLNRALVMVLANEEYQHGPKSVRRLISLGTRSSVLCGAFAAVAAWLGAVTFLPDFEYSSRVNVSLLFGIIVLVRNVHFVLAETTRGFHETNWSNLFGGPSGGPLPHLLFLIALLSINVSSLDAVLFVYLLCFAITLPPLAIKLYSLKLSGRKSESIAPKRIAGDPDLLPNIWALGIPIMLTQSFGLTISQADIWLAGGLLLPASVGIYCAAQRMLGFLTIPLQISGTAMVSFVPELLSRKNKNELQEIVGLATVTSGIPAFLIATFLIAFPKSVLTLVFGEFYASAALVLQILVIGQLICVLTGPCEMVLMMAGHQKKTLYANIVAAICIFVFGPLGIAWLGITGLALAMATVTIGQNVFNAWLVQRLVGIDTRFNTSHLSVLRLKLSEKISSMKGISNVSN